MSGPGGEARRHSDNVVWQPEPLDRAARWSALGRAGATVWITGLPASGKTTLGDALVQRLVRSGTSALRLDGDNLRHGLNGDLGFSVADRTENVRRTAHVAKLLAEAATVAVVTLVSPFERDRESAREIHTSDGLLFLEVFVDTPLAECERRDPKGLYAQARAGTLSGLTGIDGAYERPSRPDVHVTSTDLRTTVDQVETQLRQRRILSRADALAPS